MASSTRSALSSNSLPATSCICHAAVGALHPLDAHALERGRPCRPCRRRAWSAPRSRARTPSSCEDEVRSFSGQSGQVSALFSRSGGCGMISSWVTEAAPWRFEVPMQSEPVSPPPITTTCLPLARERAARARRAPRRRRRLRLFCWVRKSIAKWMPASSRPGTSQVARLLGAAGQHHHVVVVEQRLDRHVDADLDAGAEARRLRPPSARMRRSIRCFSILKSGMP